MPGIQDRSAYYNRNPIGNQSFDAGPSHSNGYPPQLRNGGDKRHYSGGGYYYSRDQQHPSSSSTSGTPKMAPPPERGRTNERARDRNGAARPGNGEHQTPSYWVEHLATFAVGRQYGLENAEDGIKKLKQMERNSAIWAQPMVLRLRPQTVVVEDENGEIVEQFPMELVKSPAAHLSTDPRDVYNNILLFVVEEDRRNSRTANTTEMHIFQCNRVSANEVVNDFRQYLSGHFGKVRPGRRDTGFVPKPENVPGADLPNGFGPSNGEPVINSYTRTESREIRPSERERTRADSERNHVIREPPSSHALRETASSNHVLRDPPPSTNVPYSNGPTAGIRDDVSASSDASEYFERDVNTLNRCFDDIERFVARIQSAALAQRELEAQQARQRSRSRTRDQGILALRAQLPGELEFVDVLQKFKLSFNLLAKLRNHIHEPNAPELLHFLFTPLTVILDACQWGLGRNIAPQVVSPLITRDGVDLMKNCLTSKESDVWMALGEPWRIPPEDWPGALPSPYRPVFADGFMPYGPPGAGLIVPEPQPVRNGGAQVRKRPGRAASVDHLELEKLSLEQERIAFEKEKIAERERRIYEEEQKILEEKKRLSDERRKFYEDQERRSVVSERPAPLSYYDQRERERGSAQSSPGQIHYGPSSDSPRQRAFLEELRARRTKITQVTYDRVGQNPKELTVSKGEYVEVLNDTKKWWECRNIHNRIGYVPHTILSVVSEGSGARSSGNNGTTTVIQQPLFVQPGPSYSGPPSSSYQPREERSSSFVQQASSSASPSNRPVELVDVVNVGSQASLPQGNPPNKLSPVNPQGTNSPRANGISSFLHSPVINNSNYQSQQQNYNSQISPVEPNIPAPPPGPPPDLTPEISRIVIPSRQNPQREEEEAAGQAPRLEAFQRNKSEAELLREELQRTVGRGQNKADLLKKGQSNNPDLVINEQSSNREIKDWLQSKGFSIRTLQVLEGQTGATLFALSKRQLQDFCGKDEGHRLYSQLLVQKNLTGYATKSGTELNAILMMRKKRSETATIKPGKGPNPSQVQSSPAPGQLDELFQAQNGGPAEADSE